MKLLLVIVDDSHKEEVEAFLHSSGVEGYTEIAPAVGVGMTGPRLGSRAFPKSSALVLTLVEEERLAALKARLRDFCEGCGERVKMVVLGVEEVLDGST
jgi:hypothetical protein